MKHLLIIFSLLLTSVSWSKDVDYNDLIKRDGLYYEKFSDEPFTGNVVGGDYNVSGKLVNGIKEGKWVEFFDNGKLWSKKNYKNGKYHGEWISYYYDGQIKIKKYYKNGKRDGEFLEYYWNGNLKLNDFYDNGIRVGIWLTYFPNGQLRYTYSYNNKGEYDGEWLTYDEDAKLIRTTIWKNDKMIQSTDHTKKKD